METEDELGVDSVSIEVSLLLAELSHEADRWGNLNREIHKYTNTPEETKGKSSLTKMDEFPGTLLRFFPQKFIL